MIYQSELVDRWSDGETTGTASNMTIIEEDCGDTVIMGFGHAVYAIRAGDGRFDPVVFTGWKGASKSTDQHIELIRPKAEIELSGRPSHTQVMGEKSLEFLANIAGNDKDYSQPHRSQQKRRSY